MGTERPTMLASAFHGYLYWITSYYSTALIFGTPVCLPTLGAVWEYAKMAFSSGAHAHYTAPYFKFRISILKEVTLHLLFFRPLFGSLSCLDHILLRAWKKQKIVNPLFVMSGARSGSTSFGQLLDEDERLCAPTMLFCTFPFLSVWMLLHATVGRFITAKAFDDFLTQRMLPEEVKVRHEAHPMKPDTYDSAFAIRQWWGLLMFHLFSPHPSTIDRIFFWDLQQEEQQRAVALIDQTARKWLSWCGGDSNGKTLLIKGHQVCMVKALKKKYPDAAFVTVLREPMDMVRSFIPFADACGIRPGHVHANDFPWWNYVSLQYYDQYCKAELELVSGDSPLVLGLSFAELITNDAAVMQKTNDWTANAWGTVAVCYEGSAHQEACNKAKLDADHVAEKAWRKSMKSRYPSQSEQQMLAMADEYADAAGVPRFDPDAAFEDYRLAVKKTLTKE